MKRFKQLTAFCLAFSIAISCMPVSVAAEEAALCSHHAEHLDCGYVAEAAASDCTHTHEDACYTTKTECTLMHEEEPDGCSEETGCITRVLQCAHSHDGDCGYAEAVSGQPCGFVCQICTNQMLMNEDLEPVDGQPDAVQGGASDTTGGASAEDPETPVSEEVQEVVSGYWVYYPMEQGAAVSGYTGTSSTVIIPSVIDGFAVTEIMSGAFSGNTTMRSVIIPDSVTLIEGNAFRDCTKLASVTIQGSPDCGAGTFQGCTALNSVDLGTITEIPDGMFYNCSALTDIFLPDTVVFIGENAFYGCALTSVMLPAKTQIAPGALGFCSELEAIDADSDSTYYQSTDGVLYSADGTKLVAYPCAKAEETYTVSQGVTTICEAAFQGDAGSLRSLYLPQSLALIEDNAYQCETALNLYFCGDAPSGLSSFQQSTKYYAEGRNGWDPSDETVVLWENSAHATEVGELYPPTCGEDGYTLDYCQRCDYTYRNTENGAKATGAHSWSDWAEISDTSHTRTCEGCQQEETAAHSWDEGTYSPAPTPNADGMLNFSCTDCGAARSETVEKLSLSGSCGDDLTWTFADGQFVVSGTGAMTNYGENEAPWSVYADCVLELHLAEGVTSIGSYAFAGCVNLTQIEIPGAVTSIGAAAFANAASLSEIRFMGAAPTIAEDAFTGVTAAAYYASTRGNWTEETLVNYGGSIAWTAFCTNGHTEQIDEAIPHTCTQSGLTEGSHCSVCAEILVAQEVVPAAHDFNENGVCQACGLVTGTCGTGLTWNLETGVLTISGQGAMTEFASASAQPWKNYRSAITAVVLEEGVTSIGKYAFYGCSKLKEVSIADTVKTVGNYAFYNGSALTSIALPTALEQIGEFAFYQCDSLTNLEIPAAVHTIGTAAFMSCGGLTAVSLPENCVNLGSMVFYDCAALTSITLPQKLTVLTEQLFGGCTGLTTVEIPAGLTQIDSSVFSGCVNLTELTFSGAAPSIAEDAFADFSATMLYPAADRSWDYVRQDYGGNPVWQPYGPDYGTCGEKLNWSFTESTGRLYFYGSNSMYDYYLPEIDEVAVPWKHLIDQVQSVEFSSYQTFEEISAYCFRGYPNLKTASLSSVKVMGEGVFQNCPQLTSVSMNAVTEIPDNAFSGCTALDRLVLPSSVKTIGQNAFSGCTGMTEMILPVGITRIGSGAFQGCTDLKSIRFSGEAPEIAEDAFQGVTAEALYRKEDASWTEEVFQNYGGQLTWKMQGVSGTCGENLHWTFDEETGILTISGTGAMTDYTGSYTAPWHINRASITSLVLEEGITAIGNYAFYDCYHITSLELPEGITSIGKSAFYGCSALTTVTIPASVTFIGNSAFYGCSKITSVNITDLAAWCSIQTESSYSNPIYYTTGLYLNGEKITQLEVPDTVEAIGSYAFAGYEALTSATIPESVSVIGKDAFYYCTGLKTAVLSEGLKTISDYAFYYAKLTAVTIPASVQAIGKNAFYYNALTTVTFMDAVPVVGSSAFASNSSLTRVNASSLSDWCATGFADASANPASLAKSLYVNDTKITSLTIPEDVSSIGAYCFYGNTAITQVTVPASVKSIGSNAFGNCSGITKVYAPDLAAWSGIAFADKFANPLYLGAALYQNSTKITKLTIPSGATRISDYAFYNVSGITSVSVPDTVTEIGNYAFYSCESLAGITLSNSVTKIGEHAFYFCTGLTSLTVPGSVKTVGYNAFNGCTALTSVVLESGVQEIGNYAFSGCTKLATLTMAESVKTLGQYAFNGCTSLTELTLGEGVETLGAYAFYGCSALTTVSIPASVKTIGSYAFYTCSGLTGVYITDLAAWSAIAFGNTYANPLYYAKKLYLNNQTVTSVVIPEGTETIPANAFYNCADLTSVTIPASVKTIGRDAFYGCSSLYYVYISDLAAWCGIDFGNEYANPLRYAKYLYENSSLLSYALTIPQGVVEIGDYAFSGAKQYSLTIPDTVKKIGSYAFSGCSNLANITLSEGLESIGAYAFKNDSRISSITIPSTVKSIGSNAFYPCSGLKTVYLPSVENWCSISFGSSHGIFTNATSVYVNYSSVAQLTIPEGVTQVPDYAFTDCDLITSVVIPEGVERVGISAFDGCAALTSVSMPASLKNIGSYAFRNCSKLETASIPAQVTSIGSYAFYNCSLLTAMSIPEGVTEIPTYTFYNCSGLTQITIPAAVKTIGNYAFQGCTGLTTIRFEGDAPTMGTIFSSVTAAVYYPVEGSGWETAINGSYGGTISWLAYSTDTTIPQGSCTDTISWVIQDDTLILTGSGAMPDYSTTGAPWYSYRSAIGKVNVLGKITYIGAYSFYGCSQLGAITFAGSMPEFSASAFSGVTAAASYQATDLSWDPDVLGNFGGSIRWNPVGQSEEYMAKGTNWILDYDGTLTYSGYSTIPDFGSSSAPWYPYKMHLKKLVLGDSVTTIGKYAFYGCSKLQTVIMGESVYNIGAYAFAYCTALEKVFLHDYSALTVGERAFYGCTSMYQLALPSYASIGAYAFGGCSALERI